MAKVRLAGSRFTKIVAERNPDFDGKINLNSGVKIKTVEPIKGSKDALNISYSFEISYGDLGKIEIEGIIFVTSDPKTIKELKKAAEKKDFDSKEQLALTNLVMQKATIKAIELEESLGLPIHLKLPSLSLKK